MLQLGKQLFCPHLFPSFFFLETNRPSVSTPSLGYDFLIEEILILGQETLTFDHIDTIVETGSFLFEVK
jgi:hypothetical protein